MPAAESGAVALAVSRSTFSGNNAANGGGLYVAGTTTGPSTLASVNVTLIDSTVSGNRAVAGAGTYFDVAANGSGGPARAAVTGSTISRHSPRDQGGGVFAEE